MIEFAQKNLSEQKTEIENVSFEVRNVLDIDKAYSEEQFNTVVSVRGLINLPSWELQKQAIEKVYKILPKGGKFIFLEGSKQGLDKINEFRAKFSLPLVSEPWYDKHFNLPQLMEYTNQYFSVQDERNLDIYFLVSRILYPLAALPNEAEFSNICNTVARLLVPFAKTDAGTTLLNSICFIKK
jgi:ubiquinone/menaquinone biosynthesis C-methylase UbiE